MKMLTLTVATFFLFGVAGSQAIAKTGDHPSLDRISEETGVPVATLQAQRTTTGLGFGELENANLLANASGQSFDTILAKRRAHEGWGKIAHDFGLNLGKIVSNAHRSTHAAAHAHATPSTPSKQIGKTRSGRSGKGSPFDVAPGSSHGHGHGHGD
jgi:hypothetical protein